MESFSRDGIINLKYKGSGEPEAQGGIDFIDGEERK